MPQLFGLSSLIAVHCSPRLVLEEESSICCNQQQGLFTSSIGVYIITLLLGFIVYITPVDCIDEGMYMQPGNNRLNSIMMLEADAHYVCVMR